MVKNVGTKDNKPRKCNSATTAFTSGVVLLTDYTVSFLHG